MGQRCWLWGSTVGCGAALSVVGQPLWGSAVGCGAALLVVGQRYGAALSVVGQRCRLWGSTVGCGAVLWGSTVGCGAALWGSAIESSGCGAAAVGRAPLVVGVAKRGGRGLTRATGTPLWAWPGAVGVTWSGGRGQAGAGSRRASTYGGGRGLHWAVGVVRGRWAWPRGSRTSPRPHLRRWAWPRGGGGRGQEEVGVARREAERCGRCGSGAVRMALSGRRRTDLSGRLCCAGGCGAGRGAGGWGGAGCGAVRGRGMGEVGGKGGRGRGWDALWPRPLR